MSYLWKSEIRFFVLVSDSRNLLIEQDFVWHFSISKLLYNIKIAYCSLELGNF